MKKTIFSLMAVAFAAAISFSTTSCGDSAPENIPDSLLAGVWETADEVMKLSLDTAGHKGFLDVRDMKSIEGACCNSNADFTWEVRGDSLNLNFGDNKFTKSFSWGNDEQKAKIEPVAEELVAKLTETYKKDTVYTYTGVVATDSTLTLNNGSEKIVMKKKDK